MTDSRLADVLTGKEDNYLLPFYWQHGDHHEKIPDQIARIRKSGCRALCVEARPHPHFGEDEWWNDMDLIISECGKLGMKVWILDDKHFPTGYANGYIEKKYPHLRQRMLVERHIDVMGPAEDAAVLVTPSSEEEPLIGVYAYRRVPDGVNQIITGEPICITDKVHGGTLTWSVPEGCWRIFFLNKSTRGGHQNYIDLISAESAAVQIEAVYEPHYQHYAKYFGNIIAGFFSDEPDFHNTIVSAHQLDPGLYEYNIGQEGLALPYNDRVLEMMSAEMGENAMPYFGELWYESEHSHITRLAYMNAITLLYRECFSRPVGNWCRAHGVEYIGHIIEDMNAHARMGYGPGHYFRALDGQDMGGIDIVLHQVMPGFANYMHTAIGLGGSYSPEFFDYVLGKLGASISHQNKRMKGRAMCEVFGAYGWGEGAPFMKWLMDFLFVRGINYFVPHAFSPDYPDPDCPPHFGAEGHDPQFEGFSAIMGYANKMAHLLSGGRHVAQVALLYHAEGEWMSGKEKSMLMQKPAKVIYDEHIDFDIVCADTFLTDARAENGKLVIGEESFAAIVVPVAAHLPAQLLAKFEEFRKNGVAVFFAGGVPAGIDAQPTPLDKLAESVREVAGSDIAFDNCFPLVRCYHIVRDGHGIFMFFNESYSETAKTTIRVNEKGQFTRLRLLEDYAVADKTDDGAISLELLPGQSEVIVFGDTDGLPVPVSCTQTTELNPTYTIELAESDNLEDFKPYVVTDKLFNISAPDKLQDFSGKMKYSFAADFAEGSFDENTVLDLGKVGQTARLWVNGKYAGIRVAMPYSFTIGKHLHAGKNKIVVETANTLARKIRDQFSFYLQLQPSGLLGPVSLKR